MNLRFGITVKILNVLRSHSFQLIHIRYANKISSKTG